jgi:hypothetical protein
VAHFDLGDFSFQYTSYPINILLFKYFLDVFVRHLFVSFPVILKCSIATKPVHTRRISLGKLFLHIPARVLDILSSFFITLYHQNMACHSTESIHPCPNHLVHQHTFPELALSSSGDGSNQQMYFRAMVFFNKKPGLTDEFFHEHWKSVHADLTMQVTGAGVDLVRYSQVN